MRSPDRPDERARQLMMAALDGELSRGESDELNHLLRHDPALEQEWQQLQRVKEVTQTMTLHHPPEETWDHYWTGVYRRLERGVAWILVSIGAIVLLSWGLWQAIQDIIGDTELPTFIKAGILALVAGGVILLVSVIREKLILRRSDPYKDVIR